MLEINKEVILKLKNKKRVHPEEDRVISLEEALALQSFPIDYIPYGSDSKPN